MSQRYVSTEEVFGWIYFCRNSVGVAISDRSATSRRVNRVGAIDLLRLAREIDRRLKRLPSYEMSEFRKLLPRIENLKADKARVSVGESVRLSYDAKPGRSPPDSGPRRGQDGKDSLVVKILDFDSPAVMTGAWGVDAKGATVEPRREGLLKLRVVCYDPSTLLSAEEVITIDVVEDE